MRVGLLISRQKRKKGLQEAGPYLILLRLTSYLPSAFSRKTSDGKIRGISKFLRLLICQFTCSGIFQQADEEWGKKKEERERKDILESRCNYFQIRRQRKQIPPKQNPKKSQTDFFSLPIGHRNRSKGGERRARTVTGTDPHF